jgi:hypothetical protein
MLNKELGCSVINKNPDKVLPAECVNIEEIKIKPQRNIGFHLSDSPRFYCTVKYFENTGISRNYLIFIKKRENAGIEYEKMVNLWSRHYYNQVKFLIPKPLYFDRKNTLLFIETFSGESFLHTLYKKLFSHQDNTIDFIKNAAILAAQWLTGFQSIFTSEEKKRIPNIFYDYEQTLATFDTLGKKEKSYIVGKLNNAVGHLPEFPDTYVHDQYLFRNILLQSDKICTFDFPNQRIGWPFYDFFRFQIGIDRLAQYPFIPFSYRTLLKEIFVSEYLNQSKLTHDRALVENFWGFFIVSYIRKIFPIQKGLRGKLSSHFINRTLNDLVSWSKT